MAENKTTRSGIGIFGILGIVFIILKLTEVIAWKWIWVLAPFWMSWSLTILILFGVCFFALMSLFKNG